MLCANALYTHLYGNSYILHEKNQTTESFQDYYLIKGRHPIFDVQGEHLIEFRENSIIF